MQFLLTNDESRDLCEVRIVFKPKVIYVDDVYPLLLKSGEPSQVLFNETTRQFAVIYQFKNYLDYIDPMSLIHINLLRKFFSNIYNVLFCVDVLDSDRKSFTGKYIEVNSCYNLNKLYTIEDINNNEFEFIPITDNDILNIKRVFRVQQEIKMKAYEFLYDKVYRNSDPKYSNMKIYYFDFLKDLNSYLCFKYNCDNNQRKRSLLRNNISNICLSVRGIRINKYRSDQINQFGAFSWYLFKKEYAEFCSKYGYDPNDLKLAKRIYDALP